MSRHKTLKGIVAESYYDEDGDDYGDDYGDEYPQQTKVKKGAAVQNDYDDYGAEGGEVPLPEMKKKKSKGPKKGKPNYQR